MVHGYGAKNTASKHIKSLSFDETGNKEKCLDSRME
jgi:hypothetical protein